MPRFTVIENRLHEDGAPVAFVPAADGGGPMAAPPQAIIVHYDAGTQDAAVAHLTRRDDLYVSAQLSLGRGGRIVQMTPLDAVAYHAGDGVLAQGQIPFNGRTLNYTAIGIELENWGWLNRADNLAAWREETWQGRVVRTPRVPLDECVFGAHPLRRGPPAWWPCYPERQIDDLVDVVAAIIDAYPTVRYIAGHDEVSPQKWDPGPAFYADRGGMAGFRGLFGCKGLGLGWSGAP